MKTKLIHFLNTYGNDFFHKLPKYKTAKHKDDFVELINFYPDSLEFYCKLTKCDENGKRIYGDYLYIKFDLFDLDEFCL